VTADHDRLADSRQDLSESLVGVAVVMISVSLRGEP
jgi:hypothetical protein